MPSRPAVSSGLLPPSPSTASRCWPRRSSSLPCSTRATGCRDGSRSGRSPRSPRSTTPGTSCTRNSISDRGRRSWPTSGCCAVTVSTRRICLPCSICRSNCRTGSPTIHLRPTPTSVPSFRCRTSLTTGPTWTPCPARCSTTRSTSPSANSSNPGSPARMATPTWCASRVASPRRSERSGYAGPEWWNSIRRRHWRGWRGPERAGAPMAGDVERRRAASGRGGRSLPSAT